MRTNAALTLTSLALAGAVALSGCAAELGEEEAIETQTGAIVAVFSPLPLTPGWINSPYNTAPAAVALADGFVYLRGAIALTNNGNSSPFIMPPGRRPSSTVSIPINLCNSVKGQILFTPEGGVLVSDKNGAMPAAACFTSLEGVSYPVTNAGHQALPLAPGWFNRGGNTRNATGTLLNGIVHLAGVIKTTGTANLAFTLPIGLRPAGNVYLPINLCNGNKGRIYVGPTGAASVYAERAWGDAQCFTSLEGVTFPVANSPANGWTCLAPQPGWTAMPFSTRNTCVKNVDGLIRLSGALATTGTNALALTLPVAMRPAQDKYVAVDLCGGTFGRILIQPSGQVFVQAETAFSNAQCFTSLESASFAR